MGCFDSVMVPCPKCGKKTEFQSKGGKCLLRVYELKDAPADVLSDVNRHAPYICPKCGTEYAYKEMKMNKDYHRQDWINCCWNCKNYQDMICINRKKGDSPAEPLCICREYKRKV